MSITKKILFPLPGPGIATKELYESITKTFVSDSGFSTSETYKFEQFLEQNFAQGPDGNINHGSRHPYLFFKKGTIIDISLGGCLLTKGTAMFIDVKTKLMSRKDLEEEDVKTRLAKRIFYSGSLSAGYSRPSNSPTWFDEEYPIRFIHEKAENDVNQYGWYQTKKLVHSVLSLRQVWLQGEKLIEQNIGPSCYKVMSLGTGPYGGFLAEGKIGLPNGAEINFEVPKQDLAPQKTKSEETEESR